MEDVLCNVWPNFSLRQTAPSFLRPFPPARMPLLSLFSGKKHTQQPQQSATLHGAPTSRSSSGDSTDYVVPDSHGPAVPKGQLRPQLTHLTASSEPSGSKLRLPFLRKSKHSDASSVVSDAAQESSKPPFLPPPARTSVFGDLSHSTLSLPLPGNASTASGSPARRPLSSGQPAMARNAHSERDVVKKRSSVFAWGSSTRDLPASAPTSTSKAKGKAKDESDAASFNLKSFKHVRPPSPRSYSNPVDSRSPTTPIGRTPGRPRVDSSYSEGGSAMKAAEFRARARRSSTSLPLASPGGSVDFDAAGRPAHSPVRPPSRTAATTPPHAHPPRPQGPSSRTASPVTMGTPRAGDARRFRLSSSETSSEEDEEEDSDDSSGFGAGKAGGNGRLVRDTTITPRSARSEVGHAGPGARGMSSERTRPAMRPPSRSEHGHASPSSTNLAARHPVPNPPPIAGSVYARPRASQSTSALAPSQSNSRISVTLPASSSVPKKGKVHSITPHPRSLLTSLRSLYLPGKVRDAGSDTSEDESDAHQNDNSDSDEPLASLVPPRRPGSSLSMASQGSKGSSGSPARRSTGKPLIDLAAPSSINAPPPLPTNLRKFERSTTEPGRLSVATSISPLLQSPVRITSSPESATLPQKQPQPVRAAARENTGFAVLSRPPRQSVSMPAAPPTASSIQQQQQQQQRPPSSTLPRPASGILKNPFPPVMQSNDSSRSGSPARQTYLSPSVPRPPFVRGESPASSTGSGSSRAQPVTPRDGSDLGSSRGGGARYDSAGNSVITDTSSGAGNEKPRRLDAHGRRFSVSFIDEPQERGRSGAPPASGAKDSPNSKKGDARRKENLSQDDALKERRRNEARAAIDVRHSFHGAV